MKATHTLICSATLFLLALFACGTQAASVVPDWNIAGIPEAGYPHFQNAVKVSFVKSGSGWMLKATQTGSANLFQFSPRAAHSVNNATFALTAKFDKKLVFTGGNLKISGKIPSLRVSKQTLWQTNLTAFGTDTLPSWLDGTPAALGFKTSGHSGWAKRYSSGAPESVYLYSNGGDFLILAAALKRHIGLATFNVQAGAITTVPVPAAVWLLGSALAGLGIVGRRKSLAAA